MESSSTAPHRSVALVALAACIISALLAGPVLARCDSPYLISTTDAAAGDHSFIWTENVFTPNYVYLDFGPVMYPGNPPVTPAFDGVFWTYGAGAANNNGTFDIDFWFSYYANPAYSFYEAGLISTNWAVSQFIEGCMTAGGTDPGALDGNECTSMLLTDEDGTTGYYAILGNRVDAQGDTFLDQPGDDGYGNGGPIILKPVPAPVVTTPLDDPVTAVDLAPPGPLDGDYQLDGSCDAVLGYRIYRQTLPSGSDPPASRAVDSGWSMAAGGSVPIPLDNPLHLPLECDTFHDVYLALSIVFDSGHETGFLSANSARIPCRCTPDSDGDGFCSGPGGDDCDDTNYHVYPGADQRCDGLNNDCDDPLWPALPPDEADTDSDSHALCEGDCDDLDAARYPGATESCDTIDNDCNETVDDGCVLSCPAPQQLEGGEVVIPASSSLAQFPKLVWTGTEYAATWQDSQGTDEVYFARLDATGAMIGAEVRLGNGQKPSRPVWTGAEFAVAYSLSGGGIVVQRLLSLIHI